MQQKFLLQFCHFTSHFAINNLPPSAQPPGHPPRRHTRQREGLSLAGRAFVAGGELLAGATAGTVEPRQQTTRSMGPHGLVGKITGNPRNPPYFMGKSMV